MCPLKVSQSKLYTPKTLTWQITKKHPLPDLASVTNSQCTLEDAVAYVSLIYRHVIPEIMGWLEHCLRKFCLSCFCCFDFFFFIQLLFRIREQLGFLTQNDLSPFFYKPQSNTGVTQQACISCSWMQPTTAVTGLMKGTQTHILNNHAVKPHDEEKWPLHKAYDVQAVGSTLWEY